MTPASAAGSAGSDACVCLDPAPGPAGRPRKPGLTTAVLDAAAQLLAEGGVNACSIEAVSRRSGVGKPAIYRRWPHRTALAIDAFARHLARDAPLLDTGHAAQDLTEAFVRLSELYSGTDGAVFTQLLAAAVLEPGAADLMRRRFFTPRRDHLLILWQRGVAAGQLRPDVDPDDAIDALFGAGVLRLLTGQRPVTAEDADQLARTVLRGLTSD